MQDEPGFEMEDPNATKLYGEWQTQRYRAPVAMNGNLPKNSRGNVEVPPHVPRLPEVRNTVAEAPLHATLCYPPRC